MPKHCSVLPHPSKRAKRALERDRPKLDPTAKQVKKTAPKSNLLVVEAETEQVLKDFEALTGSQAGLLAQLNVLIDFYRVRWVQLANMRNRLQRRRKAVCVS